MIQKANRVGYRHDNLSSCLCWKTSRWSWINIEGMARQYIWSCSHSGLPASENSQPAPKNSPPNSPFLFFRWGPILLVGVVFGADFWPKNAVPVSKSYSNGPWWTSIYNRFKKNRGVELYSKWAKEIEAWYALAWARPRLLPLAPDLPESLAYNRIIPGPRRSNPSRHPNQVY